jgi:hypothetical protein
MAKGMMKMPAPKAVPKSKGKPVPAGGKAPKSAMPMSKGKMPKY